MLTINLNDPASGTLNFEQFSYPGGQPHCEFAVDAIAAIGEKSSIEVIMAIRNGDDLLNTALAVDSLK